MLVINNDVEGIDAAYKAGICLILVLVAAITDDPQRGLQTSLLMM